MIRRPMWFGAGMVTGAAGALWAEARVRRALNRMTPDSIVREAGDSVRHFGQRAREAMELARWERARREAELRSSFITTPRHGPAHRARHARRQGVRTLR